VRVCGHSGYCRRVQKTARCRTTILEAVQVVLEAVEIAVLN
jgi:hypothetical protein